MALSRLLAQSIIALTILSNDYSTYEHLNRKISPFGGPNQISPMHLFSSINFRMFTLSSFVTYFIFISWTSALLRTHFPRLGLVCLGYHVNSLPIRLPETKPK